MAMSRQQSHNAGLRPTLIDVLPFPKCAQIAAEYANREHTQARKQAALSTTIDKVQESKHCREQNNAGRDLTAHESRFATRDCLFLVTFFQLSHFVLVKHG